MDGGAFRHQRAVSESGGKVMREEINALVAAVLFLVALVLFDLVAWLWL